MSRLDEITELAMRTAFEKVAGIVPPASRLTTITKPDVATGANLTNGADTTTRL